MKKNIGQLGQLKYTVTVNCRRIAGIKLRQSNNPAQEHYTVLLSYNQNLMCCATKYSMPLPYLAQNGGNTRRIVHEKPDRIIPIK